MDVELLVVPNCPPEKPAAVLLRSAVDDIGLTSVPFQLTVIDTSEAARAARVRRLPDDLARRCRPVRDTRSTCLSFLPPLPRPERSAGCERSTAGPQARRVRGRAPLTDLGADQVIADGLAAWGRGDLDALHSILDPAVTLRAMQPGPWDCENREQVIRLLRLRESQRDADEPRSVEVRKVDE